MTTYISTHLRVILGCLSMDGRCSDYPLREAPRASPYEGLIST